MIPLGFRSLGAAFSLVLTMLPALPIPFRFRSGSVQVPFRFRAPPGAAFFACFYEVASAANRVQVPLRFRSLGAALLLAFTVLPALPIPFRFRSGPAPPAQRFCLLLRCCQRCRFRSGSVQVPPPRRSAFACFYDVASAANSVQAPCRLRSGSAPLARRFFCLFSRCCQRCRFRSGSVQVPPPRRSAFACFYDAASAADSVQAPFRFRPPWRSARKSSMDSWRARSYPLCSNRERRFTCNIISSAAPAAVPNAWMGDWELDPQLKQESRRCPVPQFPDSQLNGSQFPIHAECRTDRAMKNVIVLWRGRHQAIDLIMTTTIQQFDCADHRGAGHVII